MAQYTAYVKKIVETIDRAGEKGGDREGRVGWEGEEEEMGGEGEEGGGEGRRG